MAYDIIIAGAGPVGLYSAMLCEKMGFRVLVLEEHENVGDPLHCSGLVSTNIRRFFPEISENSGFVENTVDSATLHSRLAKLKLMKKHTAAFVINRPLFDMFIQDQVNSEIRLGAGVTGMSIEKDCVKVRTRRGVEKAEIILGCDGAGSSIAKQIGARPREVINGIFGLTNEVDFSENVDLYFDKRVLKDGFFWKIPRGMRTEYGVLGRGVNFEYLKGFFKKSFNGKYGGVIGLGLSGKSYSERTLLVGGAAGQVKPWSGGGVVYGLTCAEVASKTVEKALLEKDFSSQNLKGYESEWKRRIGIQMFAGSMFRKFLIKSGSFEMDVAFLAAGLLPLGGLDMDFFLRF